MSGPNDSGPSATANDAPRLSLATPNSRSICPRFRLRVYWPTPRLEWRPTLSEPSRRDAPDALEDLQALRDYMRSGAFGFDLRRPRFDLIDKALWEAPTEPARLPSLAELRAAQDDAFYRRLGRDAPFYAAPTTAPPPAPFFKLPDPPPLGLDPAAPKAGAFGDVIKALFAEPPVQNAVGRMADAGLRQVDRLVAQWRQSPWLEQSGQIALAVPLAAGVVGTALAGDGARHLAFGLLKGVDIPAPFVPGLSFQINDYGRADPFLLGAGSTAPGRPLPVVFGLKFDVLKAFPAVRSIF